MHAQSASADAARGRVYANFCAKISVVFYERLCKQIDAIFSPLCAVIGEEKGVSEKNGAKLFVIIKIQLM